MNSKALTDGSGQPGTDTPITTALEVSSATEMSASGDTAAAIAEVQAALVVAKKFPRDEDRFLQRIVKSASRTSFAEGAEYSFPRGGTQVVGPSIKFAREAKRLWGNIETRLVVVSDTDGDGTVENPGKRTIRGVAWDLETNTKEAFEDTFQKLIFRKNGGWKIPDERDLRELTNRRGAILVRNAVLALLPPDMVDDAVGQCRRTLREEAKKDPDGLRKKIVLNFGSLRVPADEIANYLGNPIDQATPDQLTDLRAVYQSIRDGQTTWREVVNGPDPEPKKPAQEATKEGDIPTAPAADNDPNPDGPPWETINAIQVAGIRAQLSESGLKDADLLGALGDETIERLEHIPAQEMVRVQEILDEQGSE